MISAIQLPEMDPVLFRLGPLALRWYGLAYVAGFLVGYTGLVRMLRHGRLRLTERQLSDLLGWVVAGVLVGGRLGWWVLYHRADGAAEPWYEPLAVWRGGMSFHGGLAGVVTVMLVWCRRNGVSFLNVADCAALVAPVGLFLGRVANFINAELVGRPTAVPWGVVYAHEAVARHPSQLYEAALEGPLLLLAMWVSRRRLRSADGPAAAAFVLLYALFRFVAEFTRHPDEQLGYIAFGWLTMGQLASAATAVAAAALWLTAMWQRRQTPALSGRSKQNLDWPRSLRGWRRPGDAVEVQRSR